MNSSQTDIIRRLIGDRENKDADFKLLIDLSRNRNKKKLALDVVSFANANGGAIIVGVDNKTRQIIGIPTPLDHDKIVQSVTDSTEPPVDISVDTVEIDGKLIGFIEIPRGKARHQLRNERIVYIRRDGINYIATPEEITQLTDERDYTSRVYLAEPDRLFSIDNTVLMLSGEKQPYRKIKKQDGLGLLSECPVFLPEFSRWISAPEFGNTKGSIMISNYDFDHIKHNEFVERLSKVENQLGSLVRYLAFNLEGVLNWSISSDGKVCYGRGSETLRKALDQGELGVITVTTCGEFRGSDHQRAFLLVIGGYCKSRTNKITFVQDREIRLYLSSFPVSSGWIRALFSPFIDEDKFPFSMLSYELVHPRLRIWRPTVSTSLGIPIKGVIGRYQYQSGYDAQIGAAVADTKWYTPRYYKIDTNWPGEYIKDQDVSDRLFDTIEDNSKIVKCPTELLNECIVSLTNPVPSFNDIESKNVKGFRLPLIKHLEVEMIGHTVHVLGLNSSPIES